MLGTGEKGIDCFPNRASRIGADELKPAERRRLSPLFPAFQTQLIPLIRKSGLRPTIYYSGLRLRSRMNSEASRG